MGARAWRRIALVGVGVALGAVALAPVAAAAPAPGFDPVTTYAPPTNVPASMSCVGASFCMQLAFGGDVAVASPVLTGVLTTTDGGATWTNLGVPTALAGLADGTFPNLLPTLQCVSASECLVEQNGSVARTMDGGATWGWVSGTALDAEGLGVVFACTPSGGCLDLAQRAASWLAPGATSFARVTNPVPRDTVPQALSCPTARRCVLSVDGPHGGAILVTSDVRGGARWVTAPGGGVVNLEDLTCATAARCVGLELVSDAHGVVRPALVRSLDGGVLWQRSEPLLASAVLSANDAVGTAFACGTALDCAATVAPFKEHDGQTGALGLYTADGGKTWFSGLLSSFGDVPTTTMDGLATSDGAVACLSSGRCLADAGSLQMDSVTGVLGAIGPGYRQVPWSYLNPPSASVMATSLLCTTGSTCWRVDQYLRTGSYAARLEVSGDDGATWSGVHLPAGTAPVLIGGCQGPETCEVVGIRNTPLLDDQLGVYDYGATTTVLLSTSDGGTTWTSTTLPDVSADSGEQPLTASCTSGTACVVLVQVPGTEGPTDVLVSTTDGTSWSAYVVDDPNTGFLAGFQNGYGYPGMVSCSTGSTCMFISSAGFIVLRSENGGLSWAPLDAPPDTFVEQVACVTGSSCDALVSGTNAHEFTQTTDGGVTWSAPVGLPADVLEGEPTLSCSDLATCTVIAQGDPGPTTSLTTSDAGASWTPLSWNSTAAAGADAPGMLTCSATVCLAEDEFTNTPLYQLESATP